MQAAPLEARDAGAIATLWLAGATESAATEASFAPGQSLAECTALIQSELESKAYFGWGVFTPASGELLGYLTARVEEPGRVFRRGSVLHLLDLDVRLDARRQGIAASLVLTAKRYAQASSIERVEVGWLSADAQASAFWRAQGFRQYISRGQVTLTSGAPGA